MRKQLNPLGYKNDRRIKPEADPIEDSSEADFHDRSIRSCYNRGSILAINYGADYIESFQHVLELS